MAKRKPEDDFIYTLSDGEPEPEPPSKKTKTDDMDSDFEFMDEVEEVDWVEGAGAKVDIDEIIRRRGAGVEHDGRRGDYTDVSMDGGIDEASMDGGIDDVSMDDDDDEVLADDAFGMNAQDEEDEEGGADDDDDDDDDNAADSDSAATPVAHPDDADDSSSADAEEQARADAFFAPAPTAKAADSFVALSLSRPILRGLAAVGFATPTPIQAKMIPIALLGRDVVGGAVTGSGKTGAFMIPILERLLYRPNRVPTTRVVVLTPTRELAMQCHAVAAKLASHTDVRFALAVGGLSLKTQEAELRRRPDVVIATPGRFIDHVRNAASFSVDAVEILVLDEADRMLDDGFADELAEILGVLPRSRQTMLFSATMTSSVDRLIRVGMNRPVRLLVDGQRSTAGTLVQEFVRLRPGREDKRMGYLVHLCTVYTARIIVFFRQKREAHRARVLFGLLGLSCAELHGSMSQVERIASVEAFRDGKAAFLLATDLASRGLDIRGVDTVINYEAPQSLDIYVHRVGRTARAGRRGTAVTLAAEADRKVVKAAVKAARAQGARVASRVVSAADADGWQARVDGLSADVDAVMREESEERQLAKAEMQVRKGENLIAHEAEIKGRPRRTWFETAADKERARRAGNEELNGKAKAKDKKKLSNKDKKRLDVKAQRAEGLWKGKGGRWAGTVKPGRAGKPKANKAGRRKSGAKPRG